MARYIRKEIAQLTHQLTMSPARLREPQLDGAERLAALIKPDKTYPYDFVCYRITGYRKSRASTRSNLRGKDLLADLSRLVDDLSSDAPAPADKVAEKLYPPSALAERLSVSTKTISRWRRRGLIGRRYAFSGGKVCLAFRESSVERFVRAHQELVRRAAAFKQLTREERAEILRLARELLADRRMKLHEVAQEVSRRTGRAVETIRYTLRRHDQENPADAVFAKDETPQVCPEHRRMFDAYLAGDSVRDIAKALGRSQVSVHRIIQEMRCRRILDAPLSYMYSPEFDEPGAEKVILAEDVAESVEFARRERSGAQRVQPYLNDLASLPILTQEQEQGLFRQYNYLKFKAAQLRDDLDPLKPDGRIISRIEHLIARSEKAKTVLIKCNLRLVVSIAKRHVGSAPDLYTIASDGNLSLMRAVEKFDYTRGYKFSTYATWAVVRSYARTVPEERYRQRRFQTGADETLDTVPDRSAPCESNWEHKRLREKIGAAINSLDRRERDVVLQHFGLATSGRTRTLEEIGRSMGVTKERIRQIERRALNKLRAILPPSSLDLVRD